MKKSTKTIAEIMSDHQKIHVINETKSYKKIWVTLTNEEKRRALDETDDLWNFQDILQDILDDRKNG